MPPIVADLVIAALMLGIAYALMSEGLWGACLMFFNVLFAGIIAFNFYEPLAALIAANLGFISHLADLISLLGIFVVALVVFRLTTETLAPSMVRFPAPVYHIGRILFAVAGSAVTVAILLLGLECAPVHKKIANSIDYKRKPPFNLGLDHEWLGFFQYTTGSVFANYGGGRRDPFGEYGSAKVFDARSEWLIDHQDARPYGTDSVLTEGAGGAAGGEAAGEAAPGGAAAPGGSRPGDVKVIGPAVGGGVVIPN